MTGHYAADGKIYRRGQGTAVLQAFGDERHEIANRTCASVNACAGVPTADLRPGMLAELIRREAEMREALREIAYYSETEAQTTTGPWQEGYDTCAAEHANIAKATLGKCGND